MRKETEKLIGEMNSFIKEQKKIQKKQKRELADLDEQLVSIRRAKRRFGRK